MTASQYAAALREELLQLSINGQKTIETNFLAAQLERKIPELKESEATGKQIYVDLQKEYYKATNDSNLKMFDSVIDYGKRALNTVLIINAGAAVALLSFVGNLATKAPAHLAREFASALWPFVIGVLAAAMATGGAYCSQHYYSVKNEKTGIRFHLAAAALVILGYLSFFVGAWLAYAGMNKLASP